MKSFYTVTALFASSVLMISPVGAMGGVPGILRHPFEAARHRPGNGTNGRHGFPLNRNGTRHSYHNASHASNLTTTSSNVTSSVNLTISSNTAASTNATLNSTVFLVARNPAHDNNGKASNTASRKPRPTFKPVWFNRGNATGSFRPHHLPVHPNHLTHSSHAAAATPGLNKRASGAPPAGNQGGNGVPKNQPASNGGLRPSGSRPSESAGLRPSDRPSSNRQGGAGKGHGGHH